MRKRIIFWIVLGFMIFGLPKNILALTIDIEGIDIYQSDSQYYKLVDSVLTTDGASNEDYNIKLDKENNKLYINNFNTTDNIYTDLDELNIILEGKNSVETTEFNAIESRGNIIFSGEGNLDVIGDGNGIKSERSVVINSGEFNIHGKNYNGIEAYEIEINGGIVKTSSDTYDGIHTQPSYGMDDKFSINGGNLYVVGAINSGNKDYNNGIIIFEEENTKTMNVYGNATLLSNLTLNSDINVFVSKDAVLTIPKNIVLTISEEGVLELSNKEQLKLEGSVVLNGQIKVGDKQFYNVYITKSDNGLVSLENSIVLEGEEVELIITPNSEYELDTLKYINDTKEIAIENNKFIMPSHDVTIEATFTKVFDFENPNTSDNVIVPFILFLGSLISLLGTGIYLKTSKVK